TPACHPPPPRAKARARSARASRRAARRPIRRATSNPAARRRRAPPASTSNRDAQRPASNGVGRFFWVLPLDACGHVKLSAGSSARMHVLRLAPFLLFLASIPAHPEDLVVSIGKQRAAASPLQWDIREATHPRLGLIRFAFLKIPIV